MRKNDLKRRTFAEEQKLRFENKVPTFKFRKINNEIKKLKIIGAMLYWGEGYKGNDNSPAKLIDFANSDPDMIKTFITFLRKVYVLDESKFRVLLYCYSDQNVDELTKFWSRLVNIPISQFIKPYIRKDYKIGGQKMRYGLVHIRYHDKKLLLEIKKMIDSYRTVHFAPIV